MSSARIFGLVACWIAVVIIGFRSTVLWSKVVDEVNKKRPGAQQFSQFWWHPVKYFDVRGSYKELYPDGILLRSVRRHSIALYSAMFLAALLLFA